MKQKNYYTKSLPGQMILVVLLTLTVGATIALALIGRSTMDVSMATRTEESQRAFSAAEAGIEQLLSGSSVTSQTLSSGASYTAEVVAVGGTASVYTVPSVVNSGETETIWLVPHNADGTINESIPYTGASIDVRWTQPAGASALEIGVVVKNGTTYEVHRSNIDTNAARAGTNKFAIANAPGTNCGINDAYRTTVTFPGGATQPIMMRIRPYYANVQLYVNPGVDTLPSQGDEITSTGTVPGGTTRKIVVHKSFLSPSSLFDYVIYTQNNLGH